ncbi:MAG TPA: LysR family transcriptional regulator [Noviherbaspirillum sp.]|uniref:LysR family transcriptional regulator n=1 Tax=Noviherbaspirillum sp. TaxID=1926288 RepID=UPI002B4A3665|nr:LysR family transcriptional regulator [Noviherbaspirillum sp.]HJV88223.1 LysR family transcriptional regulator [Noviherbaspirillum sp.]
MRITLRQLQIFLAVAHSGSTSAAAGIAALSQSAASAALNELEGALNARLFDRVGKRLVLNDNGRLLLPQARQMLDAAAAIEQQFADADAAGASGLRIGASTTIGNYLLPAILGRFSQHDGRAPPHVMIANTADVARAVANFDIDVGLIEGPCHEPDLQVEPWLSDELIIVCAASHPLAAMQKQAKGAKPGRVPLKALREARWILREPGSGTREVMEHALLPHLHYLRPAGEFSNAEAIKRAAAAGIGVACQSRYVVADLIAIGQLVEVRTTLPALHRRFYLVYSRQKVVTMRLNAFMEFCRKLQFKR